MLKTLRPWQLLVVAAAGWVNRDQQAIIHYLQEENRVLREQLGSKRLRLTDDQRRRLAAKARATWRDAEDRRPLNNDGSGESWLGLLPNPGCPRESGTSRLPEHRGQSPLRLPPRSPNLNAWIERFVRSIKEYLAHYHAERNHQGLDNRLIDPNEDVGGSDGDVQCRERLGGMLRPRVRPLGMLRSN